jgi:hypothetical protein
MRTNFVSIIAVCLAGCTTTTRLTVAPAQLSELSGMAPHGERTIKPVGHRDRVTVDGDDLLQIQTKWGQLPFAAPWEPEEAKWARLSTLRSTDSEIALRSPASKLEDTVPMKDVSSAELEVTNVSAWRTTALVVGVAAVVAAVAFGAYVGIGMATSHFGAWPASSGGW